MLNWIIEQLTQIQPFIQKCGPVIWLIMLNALLLWFIIIERYLFIWFSYPGYKRNFLNAWQMIHHHEVWGATAKKRALLSQNERLLKWPLCYLKALIALCPLLGLSGTVYGMIQVFDVISIMGNSNARALANGVGQATLPTMAGMVIALPGLYFSNLLEGRCQREQHQLTNAMT